MSNNAPHVSCPYCGHAQPSGAAHCRACGRPFKPVSRKTAQEAPKPEIHQRPGSAPGRAPGGDPASSLQAMADAAYGTVSMHHRRRRWSAPLTGIAITIIVLGVAALLTYDHFGHPLKTANYSPTRTATAPSPAPPSRHAAAQQPADTAPSAAHPAATAPAAAQPPDPLQTALGKAQKLAAQQHFAEAIAVLQKARPQVKPEQRKTLDEMIAYLQKQARQQHGSTFFGIPTN